MKRIIQKILRFITQQVIFKIYNQKLPNFSKDFQGNRVFMIAELPGGCDSWEGQRRQKAQLGNTHPWNRYFNRPLKTCPKTLADIESFLSKCKYMSDKETRSQADFWEPPDIFEKRKTGDCEDHAIWAWRHLHDLGYRVRLVLGVLGGGHAWVHIFANDRVYLLEATQKTKWFPKAKSYNAHCSIENIGNKNFAFFLHAKNNNNKIS